MKNVAQLVRWLLQTAFFLTYYTGTGTGTCKYATLQKRNSPVFGSQSRKKTQKKLRLVRLIELSSSYRLEIMCSASSIRQKPTSHPSLISNFQLYILMQSTDIFQPCFSPLPCSIHTNQPSPLSHSLAPYFSCIFMLSSPKFRALT